MWMSLFNIDHHSQFTIDYSPLTTQLQNTAMTLKKPIVATLLLFLFATSRLAAQSTQSFKKSTPEAAGVSSAAISNFLDEANKSNSEFHSIMILRHGKLITKGWWTPYASSLKHTMYSCSKSFTATAVGFAISEKKLSLADKVISFFPEDVPATVSDNLAALTVKDVLSMSDGQDPDPTFTTVSRDSNWIKSFLSVPIVYKPGTKFLYNTLGTYMLSAIVQKVTGQKILDYLTPRLFKPLGITGIDWEIDPKGINTGGWGLRLKTEDMAKFGQLFLQKGIWNGKQVLPLGWVEEASKAKIIQHPDYPQSKKDSSDWDQGYCYQMWRCRHNAYRADGAFGQYIIVLPQEDAVIAITSETPDMQTEINLVWQYLLPAFHQNKLPENNRAANLLKDKLASLQLALPVKNPSAAPANNFNKTFTLEDNERQVKSLSFSLANNTCNLSFATDTATYQLAFGKGVWLKGTTSKHGPSLLDGSKAIFTGGNKFKVAGTYSFTDEHTLVLLLKYIETPHTEKITCHLDGNNITADIENSFSYGSKKITLKGIAQ
jgi:CubicO group peptidase (beta-lactamase class C family)